MTVELSEEKEENILVMARPKSSEYFLFHPQELLRIEETDDRETEQGKGHFVLRVMRIYIL